MTLPKDKIYHLIAGAIVCILTFFVFRKLDDSTRFFLCLMATGAAGVGKELIDEYIRKTKQGFDMADYLVTVIGGVLVSWINFL